MADQEYRQTRFRKGPGATEIILVRHGESEPAVPGRPFPTVDGHSDPALAPEGRAQAERVADRLADEQLDALYVTKLRRTAETAAPLAAQTGLVPVVAPELHEVHLGEWEGGVLRQKVAERDPLVQRMMTEERWDIIPGAESEAGFAARVGDGLRNILAAHPDQRVALVCHGGVIGELLRQAVESGRSFAFVGSDNGSISHLVDDRGRWIVRRFNDTSHLGGGLDLDAAPDLPGDRAPRRPETQGTTADLVHSRRTTT